MPGACRALPATAWAPPSKWAKLAFTWAPRWPWVRHGEPGEHARPVVECARQHASVGKLLGWPDEGNAITGSHELKRRIAIERADVAVEHFVPADTALYA